MDELKNLVLQTLEAKGVLGQIRAKLRTCVFKVIEQEDASLKGSGNYLENPLAAKITENEDGMICAELIRDFLEFYKMDYTMQIFVPECNLPSDNKGMKEKISGLLGVPRDDSKGKAPLLAQLVQMIKSGNIARSNMLGSPLSMASEEPRSEKKDNEKMEFSPLREEPMIAAKPAALSREPPAMVIKPKEIPERKEEPKPVKKEEPKPAKKEEPRPAPVAPAEVPKPAEKIEKPSLRDPLPPISSTFPSLFQ